MTARLLCVLLALLLARPLAPYTPLIVGLSLVTFAALLGVVAWAIFTGRAGLRPVWRHRPAWQIRPVGPVAAAMAGARR